MKKIMIVAVALAATLGASASTVQWGAKTATSLDATKVASGTAYLMYASGDIDWSKLENQTAFSLDTLKAAGFDKQFDTFNYSSSSLNKKNSALTPSSTGMDGGTYNLYTFIIGATPDESGISYLAYAGPDSVSLAAAAGMNQNKTKASFSYVATTGGDVPEPTSGLLLLLGMAGLALKRKLA